MPWSKQTQEKTSLESHTEVQWWRKSFVA